jgi:hypothetical protein
MKCPGCGTENPHVSRFCFRCGTHMLEHLTGRRRHYAMHGQEPVASLNAVTTAMPHAGMRQEAYRWALLLGLTIPVLAAVLGFLPLAVVTAAVVVPALYVVYLYDAQAWEDRPLAVIGGCMLLTGVLALLATLVWREALDPVPLLSALEQQFRGKDLVVLGLLAPVLGLLLTQVGVLLLASRPRFDDYLDGFTFGFVSGATYAAVETIVENRDVIFSGGFRSDDVDTGVWLSVVVVAALVKPLVYGLAAGLAGAAFSGFRAGPGRLSGRYLATLAEALVAVVALRAGLYLVGLVEGTAGVVLGLLWGLVVAAVLVLRGRAILHNAEMAAAVDVVQTGGEHQFQTRDLGYCAHCSMPLLDSSGFCVSCGTSTRALPKPLRRLNAAPGNPAGSPLPIGVTPVPAPPGPPPATRQEG